MSDNFTIPQIAITSESNEWASSTNNICETLTDVEDLDELNLNPVKSHLKIKIKDSGLTTDVEDLDASDIDSDEKIQTVSVDDLHLDASNFEESVAGTFGNLSQSCKIKSDSLLNLSLDEGVTDVDDIDTENELDFDDVPDANISFDDYHSNYTNISTDLKQQQSQNLECPVLDASELTDVESIPSDNEKASLIKKSKTKRRKFKGCHKNKESGGTFDMDKCYSGMKKSLSHPTCLKQQNSWAGFESDGEMEDEVFLKTQSHQKQNKTVAILTDMKNVKATIQKKSDDDETASVKENSTTTETDTDSIEDEQTEFDIIEVVLPPPVRTVVLLSENKSLVPTTKIQPLDDTVKYSLSNDEYADGLTDVEFLPDDGLLNVDEYERGPTPDIKFYDSTSVHYGENKLNLPKKDTEVLTDTEDLAIDVGPRRSKKTKNKSLHVVSLKESAVTDTEDFYLSDSNKSPLKRQNVVYDVSERSLTPYYIKEANGTTISSRDSNSSSTTKNRINVVKAKVLTTSPNLTDVEDLVASADEDAYTEVEVPSEFSKHLDQQRSSKVHIETTQKLDWNSPNEIMYLKGGSFYHNHTDVEEISDENGGADLYDYFNWGSMREWDVSKKSASQEEAPLSQDAEQQATLNYVTYESVLLRPDRDSPSLPQASYKEIDAMLEKMLVEVEKQEKLFSLDLDILEPNDDSFVNTLELVPETDALIEIPVKKAPVFESYREIQIANDDDDDDDDEPFSSLLVSHAKTASDESLTDQEDDSYEPVEYNALTHVYQRFDTYPENEVWFEGTYRNLSIVPEEDEDESTSLLSNYSNFPTRSTSSNQYSLYDSVLLQDPSDSTDSPSTDDSDFDERPDKSESIVKAEVKLLVKTSERGKEAIEIRSVREFLENPPEKTKTNEVKKKSQLGDKINSLKNKFSSIVDRSKRNFNIKPNESESCEDLLKKDKKPSFTFQQLFVKTPEPIDSNLQEAKRFGSRTELVANSSERFPLVYDPEVPLRDEDVIKEIGSVDLYANIPFYPCYNRSDLSQYGFKTFSSPHTNPFTETTSTPFNEGDQIPRAYCDWLEDSGGGLSTTTERLVASNEETLLDKPLGQQLTGLSVIDDYLVTDLKTVCEQTNAFIQSESQPEPYDALADKYTRKEPINEKKVDDNKNNMNEKKKAKKGFFGSIKTFVERSFESDSESEKSPKKSKKPKKDKKKKPKEDTAVGEHALPPRKPKLPTPPLEPSDIDSIPFVEASVSDLPPPYKPPDIPIKEEQIPVTDLDADIEIKQVEVEKKTVVEEKEPEKLSKPITDDKDKDKPKTKEKPKEKEKKKIKGKTVIVEEVTKTIQPLVIEAEEFSIIVDPTKKESPKKSKETFTINIDESIEIKEKEILEKSPILPEEKIVKPLAALEMQPEVPIRPPRTKDHIYEDIEEPAVTIPQDRVKDITTDLIQNEINFGGWSDVPAVPAKVDKEDEPQKEIVEKHDKEVLKEKDVKEKAEEEVKKKEEKKGGFFALFKKKDSKKEEEAPPADQDEKVVEKVKKPELSEAVVQDMNDSQQFLVGEVQNYHDVRPVTSPTGEAVSAGVVAAAPVKPIKEEKVEETKVEETKLEEVKVQEPKAQSESFFGLFKKQKKEEKVPAEKKSDPTEKKPKKDDKKVDEKKVAVVLSEEVLKNILDSKRFLEGEVQNYHDVRPEKLLIEQTVEPILEVTKEPLSPKEVVDERLSTKPGKGLEPPPKKAPDGKKESSPKRTIDDSKEPSPKKAVDDKREASPKPSPGFFGLFKKSKKDEPDAAETTRVLSEQVVKEMEETDQFLVAEVDNYHDVKPLVHEKVIEKPVAEKPVVEKPVVGKPVVEKPVESVKVEAEAAEAQAQSGGFFGLFKKSKKDDEVQPPKIILSEATVKDMSDTNEFLTGEVQNYQDARSVPEKVIEEGKATESDEQPSSGFFGLFKKTKKEDEKIVPEVKKEDVELLASSVEEKVCKVIAAEEDKAAKVVEEVRESSPRPAPGFFGLFKKSKKDEEEIIPSKPPLSDSVVKDMDDSNQFLSTEVDNYNDVKPAKFEQIEITKSPVAVESSPKPSRGVFDIFKKSKKDESVESEPSVTDTVVKEIKDVEQSVKGEVAVQKEKISAETEKVTKVVEEGVESSPKSSRGLFGIFKKTKKDSEEATEPKFVISEAALQAINDTNVFLTGEVDNYHDVKPEKFEAIEEDKIVKAGEEALESSPKPSRGLFGIFKKSKKDQEEVADTKPILSESVQKEMAETDTFLSVEVEHYEDAEPIKEEKIAKVEESIESSPKPTKGLFGMFKKPKKEEEVSSGLVLSEQVVQEMEDTKQFLTGEVDNYHDVKPQIISEEEKATKVTQEDIESSPKASRGLFGIFKSPKKDKEEPSQPKIILSEETQRNIVDTDRFLTEEVEKYHDARPVVEGTVSEAPDEIKEPSPKPTTGILGMFKKTKKEEVEIVEITEPLVDTVQQVTDDTKQIVIETKQTVVSEAEKIEDVKPVKIEEVTQVVTITDGQDIEPRPEVKGGFLFKFKKTKKKPSLAETQLSEEVQKSVDDTKSFLSTEVKNYEDAKPQIPTDDKKEEKTVTFEATKSKMVLEGHLPQPEVAQVVDVIKAEVTDVVKEVHEEVKEVEDVVLQEATEVQHVIEPQDTSKKEKPAKDKKGFFHRFGKKKSQDTSFDEARGRSIEESEGSPKKQKRRKSSSPFKFFDKMKKSEEDVKEMEPSVEVKIDDVTKEEVKEDLLAVEFEEEPAMDLSKEVLGSLDKKMEALKRKYTPEVQKQMNDCRDFLFIEVDNYEDAKQLVVTDIDTGLSTDAGKTVDDIIEKAAKVVEHSKVPVDAAKSEAIASAEKITSQVEDTARKTSKKAEKKSGGFFSKLGNLISGTVDDSKSELKDAKKSAEKAADKTKQSVEKSVDSAAKSVDSGVEKMKEKTKEAQQVASDKVTETKDGAKELQEAAVQATREKIDEVAAAKDSAKDKTAQKIDDAKQDVMALKESLLEVTAKTGQKLDSLKKDIAVKAELAAGEAKEVKDSVAAKSDGVKKEVEAAVHKTKADVQKSAQEMHDMTSTKIDEIEKTKESVQSKVEDAAKTAAEETSKKFVDFREGGSELISGKVAEIEKAKVDATEAVTEKGLKMKKDLETTAEKGKETVAGALGKIVDSTTQKIEEMGKVKDATVETATKKVEAAKVETESKAQTFTDAAASKLDQIQSATDAAKTGVETKASHVLDTTGKYTQDIKSQVETTTQEAIDGVKGKADVLTKTKDKIVEDIQTSAAQKVGELVATGESAKTAAGEKIDTVSKAVTQKTEDLSKGIRDSIEQKTTEVKQAKDDAAKKVDDFGKAASQKFEDVKILKQDITDRGAKQLSDFQKTGEGLQKAAADKFDQQKEKVTEKGAAAVESLQASIHGKVGEIQETKDKAAGAIATKFDDVSKVASQKVDAFEKAKQQAVDSATDTVSRLEKTGEEVKKAVGEKVDQKREDVVQIKDDIKDASGRKLEEISKITTGKIDALAHGKKQVEDFIARETSEAIKAEQDIKKAASVKVDDVKKAATGKIDDLVQIKEAVKETGAQKVDELRKTAADKAEDVAKAKTTLETQASQAAGDFMSAASQKIGETKEKLKEDTSKKVERMDDLLTGKIDDLVQMKQSVKETGAQKVEELRKAAADKTEDVAKAKTTVETQASQAIGGFMSAASQKIGQTKGKLKGDTSKKVERMDDLLAGKIDDLVQIKESVKETGAQKVDELRKTASDKTEDVAKAKTTVETQASQAIGGFMSAASQKIDHTKEKLKEDTSKKVERMDDLLAGKIDDLVQVKESVKETGTQKVDELRKAAADKTDDVAKAKTTLESQATQAIGGFMSAASQKIDQTKEKLKEDTSKKVEGMDDLLTGKIDDLMQIKQSVKETGAQKADELRKAAADKTEDVAKAKTALETQASQAAGDFMSAASQKIGQTKEKFKEDTSKKVERMDDLLTRKIDDVVQIKESVKETGAQKLDELRKSAADKTEDVAKAKTTLETQASQAAGDFMSAASQKIGQTKEKLKEDTSKKVDDISKTKKSLEDIAAQKIDTVKDAAKSEVEYISKTASKQVDDLFQKKESMEKSLAEKSKGIVDDLSGKRDKITDESVKAKQEATDALKGFMEQKISDITTISEDASKKTSGLQEEVSQKIAGVTEDKDAAKQTAAQKVDEISRTGAAKVDEWLTKGDLFATSTAKKTEETVQKMEKPLKTVQGLPSAKLEDVAKTKDTVSGAFKQEVGDATKVKKSIVDDLTKLESAVKDTSVKIIEELSKKKKPAEAVVADVVEDKKKAAASEMMELDDQLAQLTSSLDQLSEPVIQQGEKITSYVTSPTMARRAESQRFSREERPTVREVKIMQADDESDEEKYTVTEPEEAQEKKRKPLFHLESEEDDPVELAKMKDRRDSVRSNVLETLTENKLDNLLSDLESQLVKDLERSVTEGSEKTEEKEKAGSTLSKAESELEEIKKDSQADVEQIEQKLRDLDKALDSLEQASDPKLEKKLHRVERKFERMASEVMDKDGAGVSPTEVEAHREHEFQKLVSQLSTEEVSDFQKEYSHLWDETTFSKSDDWDSKTPDSQVDVQELPQGEVVYMGPVTLNKDNLVNKAGVEVDVIPIMRSPCHTPRPTKKNKRAKSALDFYEETSPPKEFDRGSLPDLKRTSLKGSLISTIIQLNPDRFLYGSTASLRSTASSSSDLSRGEIMNAVLDWLDKSNRMDESSVDTVSVASSDSNLSQPSGKTNPAVPAIRITKGQGKKRAKRKGKFERRETTCAPTLTEEIKTIPQPKPRFAKETPPLQFKEGRQPKLEKQISPVRDDLLDEEEPAVPETYSDKKKFWENVTKDKRMSLHEGPTPEKDLVKKRVSVHEVPIPKPRSQVQVTPSIEEAAPSKIDEEPETKIMSEYQASFQPPSERKSKSPPKVESDKESTDSESDNLAHSGTNENAGYISDSGDVEHYISDSEIEDRVPQIRERQMSVFAPPVAAARKTIYERSASLPTEDMYEVSARSIKLRKQYYEEQIKKEMIEEQLTSEIEEEPSPERKTLIGSLVQQISEEKVPVLDIARSFDEATKKEVSFEDHRQAHKPEKTITHIEDETPISQQFQETHKEIDVDAQTKRSSLGSEQSSSSDIDRVTRNGSTSKPDSMEVHVDKSEIEDSEKLADLDQDATDLETKSLDSLNAVEMSPKSATFVDDSIPEITVTLSGKQRRISEESDEYAPKSDKKTELDSPIHVPEEHVEDTVWEVSVQSQPEAHFDEKVTSFDGAPVEKIDEDLSLSTRDESDLGSEIHQDHSDSYASDKIKSESHSDIERIIMDSLQHQKVDPIEAKAIASALIEEIEAEIQRRECLPPATTTGEVSDYLKYLAETKGLDEREVELVESVLARRQRELAKLSRGDTQASSIEITDEDLKYSGTEGDTTHVLEQQISQLKAEKLDDIKSMTLLDKIDEKHTEETHLSKDYETVEGGITTGLKSEVHTKTFESIKGEKSEAKDIIFEEDETISESVGQESEQLETRVEAVTSEMLHKKVKDIEVDEYRETSVDVSKEKTTDITTKTVETEGEDVHKRKIEDATHERDITKSIIKHHVDMTEKSPTDEVKLKGEITCEDYLSKEDTIKKEVTSETKQVDGVAVEKEEALEKSRTTTIQKEVIDQETEVRTLKDEDSVVKESKISSKVTSTDVIRELSTVTEIKEKIEVIDIDPSLLPVELDEVKTVIEKHEEIKRTSSSESKSSVESGKSPEDQFSTCSSGRKGDSDSSKVLEKPEVLMRKTSTLQKADRKSGIDFEAYSSSGESHYHSFELDSGKSRPCSSDVEGLVAAGSSEYESALTSQDYSSRSHITSTEYHTAVSSLSSKESMKSLDSESSGHLGSVEVSELSETLVPSASDAEGDILDAVDQLDDGPWNEEIMDEPADTQTKMKRSYEMTFQPEPKILAAESPQADEMDRKFTSMDDGSIVSMSLSSTSGTTEPRTVIELSRADSERMDGGSMSVSGISDQLSIEGSCDSLVFHPTAPLGTTETGTSTGQIEGNLQIESITFTTSIVHESGIRSVSTQVTSESHTPEEDRAIKTEEPLMNGKCPPETKKKTHRRQESTSSFVPPVLSSFDQKFHSDLTESDKYTAELSFKEVISDEKKDIDEREREESYETEADQGFHRDIREGKYHETEEEIKDDTPEFSSETQASVGELEQEYTSALARAQEAKKKSETPDLHLHKEQLEKRDSHGKSSSTSSEKSSFEEAEAEAAFNMVAHVSPAHKIKQICPILEDEDAEKHELETRERAQKEYEKRRSQLRDQSPGSIPDIKVTQHMTPLVDRNFRYPDLELEEQERAKEKEKEAETQKSTPQTPSSKSSEDTDQGREYVLEDSGISIPEEAATESKSTVIEQTVKEEADKDTDSPNSDSFEMLEKPDLIDDFVVIEEVAKEAQEFDSEGKSVSIHQKSKQKQRAKKHDEEVEAYLTRSAPTPLTRMTDVKFYPDGSSSDELGFEFEDSPPINNEAAASSYEKELEANKKWIEQQFQGDQAARLAAGYDYEMEFERGPLEDIKEEDINDFDPTSSRIGSVGSQKESGGSLGSVKDSYSSTPEYDVLAGRKYFTRSGEHDDISMSSLQEFENLERAMSLENRRYHQGSQDSSSNGSFKTRYYASKSGQGDDVSVSSLKEFEGLEMACIAAHKIETKAKEEEAMLAQIDEGQESIASESESCETVSRTDKKIIPDSDEEDYEKRMFEIDEIIRQAQSNVERFIDLKEADKTESLGRGDSIEEVAKVPDLDLDAPIVRTTVKVQWKENEDVMVTSTDSIDGKEEKESQHDSTDSLDQKTCADIMTASTDSIEFQAKKSEPEPINLLSDSIEIKDDKDEACGMISSDSLELATRQSETMLESTDSLADPTSSTATHATYQYETDSVFSGSFTSGGSNTMVSSTDTIDPVQVDIAAAARKVWFEEETGTSRKFSTEYIQDSGKPYVTEVIEPSDDDGFSHTIHRRVELPPEVRKVTFYGSDADERLKQFIEDFNEGEHVEEVQEVDAAGNVHTRRVVQKRFIIRGEEGPDMEEFIKKTVASKTNELTSIPKETTGEESSLAATGGPQDSASKAHASRRRQLRYEISVDDQIEVDPREHDWRFNLPKHAEGEESTASGPQEDTTSSQQRPVADQHQLSEEMKQLLKELEKESKQ